MKHTLLYIIAFLLPALSSAQVTNFPPSRGDAEGRGVEYPQEVLIDTLHSIINNSPFRVGGTSTVGIEFYDLTVDSTLFAYNEHLTLRPASTMKLTTAIAALNILGGEYKFLTSMKCEDRKRITLIGGMDPCFDSADMHAFIDTLLTLNIDTIYAPIVEDKILKDTLLLGSGWCWDDKNPQLTPLLYNGENNFLQAFKDSLTANGIVVTDNPISNTTTPEELERLYITRSHTIDQVLLPMLKNSNNLYAEALFYQLSPTNRRSPLFSGHTTNNTTAKEISLILDSLINKAIYSLPTGRGGESLGRLFSDGSGLSLYNYQSTDYQVRLLRYAYQHPEIYNHLYPALPIAGIDGTLKSRMKDTSAQGNVHAKTGTVTGVSSLAGYLTAKNGHLICFSIINQGCLRSKAARDFQDHLCTIMCE